MLLFHRLLARSSPPLLSTRLARMSTTTSTATGPAVPPQSFALHRTLFNGDFYTRIRTLWFAGLPPDRKIMNDATAKRWWGKGATPAERSAFDDECRALCAPALESIGPARLALPAFVSYATDAANAGGLTAPFLREVGEANAADPRRGADTLLALVLLLDQMPRNIYRDPAGLRLVYGHYDRLAWALLAASKALEPDPRRHRVFRGNPAFASWLSMPLMHAEDVESQEDGLVEMARVQEEAREDGDEETANAPEVSAGVGFAKTHADIIERFGRFPHRHECLGREFTTAEEEWMRDSGQTFGVKQGQKEQS